MIIAIVIAFLGFLGGAYLATLFFDEAPEDMPWMPQTRRL